MDCFHVGACAFPALNLLAYLLLQVQFVLACCVFFGVIFEILTKTGGHNLKKSLQMVIAAMKLKDAYSPSTRKSCAPTRSVWCPGLTDSV